jgi:hypothetical protein
VATVHLNPLEEDRLDLQEAGVNDDRSWIHDPRDEEEGDETAAEV